MWSDLSVEERLLLLDQQRSQNLARQLFCEALEGISHEDRDALTNALTNCGLRFPQLDYESWAPRILWQNWLQLKQSIPATIISGIAELPTNFPFESLTLAAKAVKDTPAFYGLSDYHRSLAQILASWSRLQAAIPGEHTAKLFVQVVQPLARFAGCEAWAYEFDEQTELPYCLVDIEALQLRNSSETLWCFLRATGPNETESLLNLINRRSDPSDRVYIVTNKTINRDSLGSVGRRLVIINESDILSLLKLKKGHNQWLIDKNIDQLPLGLTSPYHSGTPRRAVFVGRDQYLTSINQAASGNVVLFGPRKNGKTSILYRLGGAPRRRPTRKNNAVDVSKRVGADDLESINGDDRWSVAGYHDFSGDRVWDIYSKLGEILDRPNIASYEQLETELFKRKRKDQHIIFLMDEVDGLFKEDATATNKVFWSLRKLANQGLCRFVVAGFLNLYDAIRDIHSPFYNFGTELFLNPLTHSEAHRLICEPFKRMKVSFHSQTECVRLICETTENHPGYIQKVCEELVRVLEQDGTRTITPSMVQHAMNRINLNHIYSDTFDRLDPIAKAILEILSTRGVGTLTYPEISEHESFRGSNISPSLMRRCLRSVEMAGFMVVENQTYRMRSPRMKAIVNELKQTTNNKLSEKAFIRSFAASQSD